MVKRFTSLLLVFLAIGTGLQAQQKWDEVLPGIWKTEIGIPEDYNLLKAAGTEPLKEGFSRLPEIKIPELSEQIQGWTSDGATSITVPLSKGEHLYGFGLNFQTVEQRGKVLGLHVDHYGGRDNGRTHAPVPFYISSKGYGIFVNSARYMNVWAGSGALKDSPAAPVAKDRNTDKTWSSRPYSDRVSIQLNAQGAEVYLIAGPTMMDVVRRYNLLCGGGTLPPRWGLGFTQRTQRLFTADDVIKEAEAFEKNGFPLDFIGLEPGWQSKAYPCTLEWDKTRYPDPAGFLKAMKDKKVRINLWTNPYISPDAKIYNDLYPLSGSHTVWCGIVPDLNMAKTREILSEALKSNHIGIGVSGYKIDEVDGYDYYLWPDVAKFPSGMSAQQMRQTYGLLCQKLTADLYHEKNERTYGLVRASNGGASSLPYVIYDDYYAHPDFITALINSGFAGVLWTPEVRSSKTAEEWLRRFQTGIFSPMAMINAWSSGTKPWSFAEVSDQIRELAMLRMRLMPYFYSEFARYHFDGIPPFYSVNLEPGLSMDSETLTSGNQNLEDNPYLEAITKEIKDEYMAGQNILVAPIFAKQKSRKVILPKGNWYDFYTGAYVGNGEIIEVQAGRDMPVYVKDGALIPLMEERLHAPENGEKYTLTVRHYGVKDGSYKLYDDDGVTFDYEKGNYSWRTITVTADKNGKKKGHISPATKGKPDNIKSVTFEFMTK